MVRLCRFFDAGRQLTVRCALATALLAFGVAQPAPAETQATSAPALTAPATTQPTTRPAGRGPSPFDWAPSGDKTGSSTTKILTRMLAYLLVILVVGGVGMVVLKRVMPRLNVRAGREISVVETAFLGPRKAVHLLKVDGRRFLLGSTKDGISMLAEVTPGFSSVLSEQQEKSFAAAGPAGLAEESPKAQDDV